MFVCKVFVLVAFDSPRERRVGEGAIWLMSTSKDRFGVCRNGPVPV